MSFVSQTIFDQYTKPCTDKNNIVREINKLLLIIQSFATRSITSFTAFHNKNKMPKYCMDYRSMVGFRLVIIRSSIQV